jgi:hypothetical protein
MCREYGELSTMFYELTKPAGFSIEGDMEYYSQKLSSISGRVLEAGVGTERMLIPLIKSGVVIDGVDSSAEMLEQCRINLQRHGVTAALYEQDLVDLSLPRKYDAIIMPAGSFCLLPREKAQKVLKNFHDHLNIDGKIIIDLEMPISFQESASTTRQIPVSEDTYLLLSSCSSKIEWLTQKTSYTNRYELIKKGKLIKTETSNFTLYWYGIAEFEMRLSLLEYKDISYEIGYGKQQSDIVTFTASP